MVSMLLRPSESLPQVGSKDAKQQRGVLQPHRWVDEVSDPQQAFGDRGVVAGGVQHRPDQTARSHRCREGLRFDDRLRSLA